MKRNIPKPALVLLIIGLLTSTVTPLIGRYFLLPDYVKGVIMGLGIGLEFNALVMIQRSKRRLNCVTEAINV